MISSMRKQYIYKCHITNYYAEFILDEDTNIAIFNTLITDYKQIKPLMALIRTSIDKLTKLNVKDIQQIVTYYDWENYLKNKTSWKINNNDKINELYEITCPIEDFLENYGVGIGL